jgi:hypothetical protein
LDKTLKFDENIEIMKLHFTSIKSIATVQKEFNELYPFLKIEFFSKPHQDGKTSWAKFMINDHGKSLGEIGLVKDFEISVDPKETVSSFEMGVFETGALSLQVFRKSMGVWLITAETDMWSLSKQNAKGKEDSEHTSSIFTEGYRDPED